MDMPSPPAVIYTTSVCPYCVEAKKILTAEGIEYQEIDVSDPVLRAQLIEKSNGKKTVPQIFIKGHHVGGCDDLKVLKSTGELKNLVNAIQQE